jgi:hypothetical protein
MAMFYKINARPLMAGLAMLGAIAFGTPMATAQEAGPFSDGSQAESWGLLGEEPARFTATVVDILCELTGDCPANCGEGTRHLGLLREADGQLVLAAKNAQAAFNGAVSDLLPHCGQRIEVDGLLVGDKEITPLGAKIFQVQLIRGPGGDWQKATLWTKQWQEDHPQATGAGPWYRRDPRVRAQIEANGYLGLGTQADQTFIEENY